MNTPIDHELAAKYLAESLLDWRRVLGVAGFAMHRSVRIQNPPLSLIWAVALARHSNCGRSR
jgi:hypothetical protein